MCSDNCKNTTGNVSMLSDGGRRVVATFTNLTENRIYSASALVYYDGEMMHHSHPEDISECVSSISYVIINIYF